MQLLNSKPNSEYYHISKETRQEIAVRKCTNLQCDCKVSQHFLNKDN